MADVGFSNQLNVVANVVCFCSFFVVLFSFFFFFFYYLFIYLFMCECVMRVVCESILFYSRSP